MIKYFIYLIVFVIVLFITSLISVITTELEVVDLKVMFIGYIWVSLCMWINTYLLRVLGIYHEPSKN